MISLRKTFRLIELALVLFFILIVCQLVFRLFEEFRISSGIHPSRASIVAISDDLDGETFLLPKIDPSNKAPIEKKSSSIDFLGFAPPGKIVSVAFNDEILDRKSNDQGIFVVPDIRLRRGLNVLHVGLKTDNGDDALKRAFLVGSLMAYGQSDIHLGSNFTQIRRIIDTPLEIIVSDLKKKQFRQDDRFRRCRAFVGSTVS